jgi:hypothetical protein
MTTLLTPPAGDGRTPEEYTYDMMKTGTAYTKADPFIAICDQIDQ